MTAVFSKQSRYRLVPDVTVPDAPGLGVDLNEEEIRRQLHDGAAYFADTSEWNKNRVGPEWAPHDD